MSVKKTLKGFISNLFQHELDHLNGVIMLDLHKRITNFSPVSGNPVKNNIIKRMLDEYYKGL